MKRSQIVILVAVIAAMGFVISSISDSSTYADFSEAFAHTDEEYHVVGQLNKEEDVIYAPEINPTLTEFSLVDNNGETKKVKLYKAKPQDFERSESIVLIGEAKADGYFHANEILMKCPSKYNEQNQVEV
jgi:cytochrome c-type biogenesis protein CcmE